MILAIDRPLMALIKEKAPYSRTDGKHLGVIPELGVAGFLMTMTICHIRSTKPMGGVAPPLLLRSHTTITTTSTPLAVTIQLLEDKIIHGITHSIHQAQGSMVLLHRQDSITTPISTLKEVRPELTFGFVVVLTVDLLGMYSACNTVSLKELFSVSSEQLYTLC